MFKENQLLNKGKYRIIKTLGGGGFGVTYLAENVGDKTKVAIKTLNTIAYANEPDFEELQDKFVAEGLILAGCNHPHIVKIYPNFFREDGLCCIIMEFINGKSLGNYLVNQQKLAEKEALVWIQEVAGAVNYLHQEKNVLHRDIKPENIMIRGDNNQAVLIDFGLAREIDFLKTTTKTNSRTPAYAPPEQFEARGRFTQALDVYAMSATLYHLLTGQPPHPPANLRLEFNLPLPTPKQLNPQISDRVNDAILKGLELKAENRPQNIDEWLGLLILKKTLVNPVSEPPLIPSNKGKDKIELKSEKGIDYRQLEAYLKAGEWRKADEETSARMLQAMDKDDWWDVYSDDVKKFPVKDLRTIDQLWLKYSNGKFGFSVQKKIWTSPQVGGKVGEYNWDKYKKLAEIVGWRKNNKWLSYNQLRFNINGSQGHFPNWGVLWFVRRRRFRIWLDAWWLFLVGWCIVIYCTLFVFGGWLIFVLGWWSWGLLLVSWSLFGLFIWVCPLVMKFHLERIMIDCLFLEHSR